MAIAVTLEKDKLWLNDFPLVPLRYYDTAQKFPCMRLPIEDIKSKIKFPAYVKQEDLNRLGISTTAFNHYEKEDPKSLPVFFQQTAKFKNSLETAAPIVTKYIDKKHWSFFYDAAYSCRFMGLHVAGNSERAYKNEGMPGLYFSKNSIETHVFANLKGTKPLGFGAAAKVRMAAWITADRTEQILVAKKVARDPNNKDHIRHLTQETYRLGEFQNKRGIISVIAASVFKDKLAIFLPFYEANFAKSSFQNLPLHELLSVMDQLLEGLDTISQKGTHVDIKEENILLKRDANNNLLAVIADFGIFCPLDTKMKNLYIESMIAPEHLKNTVVAPPQDVWALGLVLAQKFSKKRLPHNQITRDNGTLADRMDWLETLQPGWILEHLAPETPPFVQEVLNGMLDPDPKTRLTAKAARELFLKGYEALMSSQPVATPASFEGKTEAL